MRFVEVGTTLEQDDHDSLVFPRDERASKNFQVYASVPPKLLAIYYILYLESLQPPKVGGPWGIPADSEFVRDTAPV